ncbi:MAG: aminoacyl-histidine dipeptidase [Eubacterium sp.]|nr:aminoacyl-histidine dipeptidase [Eubacterium sp.]
MGVLSNLEPKEVFAYFEEISSIPRASYHEDKISNYCADFARKHNLVYYQDDLKNVIIIKEATAGYEQEEPVILQGHLDMVCEKTPDCGIDFETDGLAIRTEGDYITADGTTLGADNGIAIAYVLAILASDTIAHPRLEVIFTVSEEVGMEGASGVDVSMLKGRRLINLDSEEEGYLLAGCAGGSRAVSRMTLNKISAEGASMKITVTGLKGGHSGVEINKGRANANMLMGRILMGLARNVNYHLSSIAGGNKDNAIPRECTVLLCMAEQDLDTAVRELAQMQQDIANEYAVTDSRITIETERDTDVPFFMLDEAGTKQAVMLINALPNGIQAMSADVEGLVETSLNLGVLRLEGAQLELSYAVRSSVESAKAALHDKMSYLTEGLGGEIEISGDYPAWEFKRNSPLRDKMAAVYEKMYGKKPVIEAIHAGLECGLLAGKLPGLDCISVGPDMEAVHTTEEKLSISSTKRVWEYILEVLKTK